MGYTRPSYSGKRNNNYAVWTETRIPNSKFKIKVSEAFATNFPHTKNVIYDPITEYLVSYMTPLQSTLCHIWPHYRVHCVIYDPITEYIVSYMTPLQSTLCHIWLHYRVHCVIYDPITEYLVSYMTSLQSTLCHIWPHYRVPCVIYEPIVNFESCYKCCIP